MVASANPAQLKRLLQQGRGGAIQMVQDHRDIRYRSVILDACLSDCRQQCEDSRAGYLLDIIRATGDMEFYRKELLKALADPPDEEGLGQLFALVRRLASEGCQDARDTLYRVFERNARDGELSGGEEIVWLDGLEGLLYALRLTPPAVMDEEDWLPEAWIEALLQRDGQEAAMQALDKASMREPRLVVPLERVYERLDDVGQFAVACKAGDRPSHQSYRDLRNRIVLDPEGALSFAHHWGQMAETADLERAADDLLCESRQDRLLAYVSVFQDRAFPRDPGFLLELARCGKSKLPVAALRALALVRDVRVRLLALELVKDPGLRAAAVRLLAANFEPGDETILLQLLKMHIGDDRRHQVSLSVLEVMNANPAGSWDNCLLALYDTAVCSVCRRGAVALLAQGGTLPVGLSDEMRFDCDEGTRQLAARWGAGNP